MQAQYYLRVCRDALSKAELRENFIISFNERIRHTIALGHGDVTGGPVGAELWEGREDAARSLWTAQLAGVM